MKNLLPDTEFLITITETRSKKSVSKTLKTGSVNKYKEYGAVPNMANVLYVTNEDYQKDDDAYQKSKYQNKITTIKASNVPKVSEAYFYIYLKWTYAQKSPEHTTNMLIFLQTPTNAIYYQTNTETFEGTPDRRWYWWWYVPIDSIMESYQDDHPQMEKGEYNVWVFFNNLFFRKTSFTIK